MKETDNLKFISTKIDQEKNITDLAIRLNLNKLLTNIMKNLLDCKHIKHKT